MKNISKIIFLLITITTFASCNMVIDKDTTNSISATSVKPLMQLNGDPIMSLKKGSAFVEEGVSASEVSLGGTDLPYEITEGNVDINTPAFYVVEYKAVNKYDWTNYVYRSVLVWEGTAYGDDISGTYKANNIIPDEEITKYDLPGYWKINNIWQGTGTVFPIVFADRKDGTYGIVPGVHPTKGRYRGEIEIKTIFGKRTLTATIELISSTGVSTKIPHVWKQQ